MKVLTLIIFLFISSFAIAQSYLIDSIGVNNKGQTIIQVTEIDTLENGKIRHEFYKSTKQRFRTESISQIKAINTEINFLKQQIAGLKQRKADLKAAFNIQDNETE